jgi:site-specific recombinase XerD
MRVTIAGRRFEVATRRRVDIDTWSKKTGRVVANGSVAKATNNLLEALLARAYDYQRQIINEGRRLTVDTFRRKWHDLPNEAPVFLLKVFQEHNSQVEALVGSGYAERTLERYTTAKLHTMRFMKSRYGIDDIDVRQLKYEFITDFEFWLRSVRRCDHNTTMKYLSNFKKVIHICIRKGWLHRDPFAGFKIAKRETNPCFLVDDELTLLRNKKFEDERLRQIRDVFIFCCYTGLSYADADKLRTCEITNGIDSEKWIWTQRQKTNSPTKLPLLPVAIEIIERYKNNPLCGIDERVLPPISNHAMNRGLKSIALACGIGKRVTCHVARHTFATTVTLNNGVPIESVSRMLGHRNLKTTQHYAKILDLKISEDMKRLRAKIA